MKPLNQTIQISETAYAKINLYLHVLSKRSDGYHNLETLMFFCDFGDRLVFNFNKSLTENKLNISGPQSHSLLSENLKDNLVYKAMMAFQSVFSSDFMDVHIEKHILVGAGLGGGSADVAATLRVLARFYKIDLFDFRLEQIAKTLGADVLACLYSKPFIARERGDLLKNIDLSLNLPCVLINPNQFVSTKHVFSLYDQEQKSDVNPRIFGKPMEKEKASNGIKEDRFDLSSFSKIIEQLKYYQNDLQKNAISICPEIEDILYTLKTSKGHVFSRMTGSGASCFGFFKTELEALQCIKHVHQTHPKWWVKLCYQTINM